MYVYTEETATTPDKPSAMQVKYELLMTEDEAERAAARSVHGYDLVSSYTGDESHSECRLYQDAEFPIFWLRVSWVPASDNDLARLSA